MSLSKRPRTPQRLQHASFVTPLALPWTHGFMPRQCLAHRPPIPRVLCTNLPRSEGSTRKSVAAKGAEDLLIQTYGAPPPRRTSAIRQKHTQSPVSTNQPEAQPPLKTDKENEKKVSSKRVMSAETRRKIAYKMLGQPKSKEMRAKVSQRMKGRVPWNKGKKMSPETCARMSEARRGRDAWNTGRQLTTDHRKAISMSMREGGRVVSHDTRRRLRLARRRPGDGIVSGSSAARPSVGTYPLVDSSDINDFVTMRRVLRVWSDSFMKRNSRRPSLADVRRVAPKSILRKFEKYVEMRDRIRGLAADVYGSINPTDLPAVPAGNISSSPKNNSQTTIRVTKHGNTRLVSEKGRGVDENETYKDRGSVLEGSRRDMWDIYDRPRSPGAQGNDNNVHSSLVGVHELSPRKEEQLSANDYRMIGRYRLMETIDINRYVSLRKELEKWSAAFKEKYGRTPTLSDTRSPGKSMLYNRFCDYLSMRDRMSGLVREVYGTEIDDTETFEKVIHVGKKKLAALRTGNVAKQKDTETSKNAIEESDQKF